MHLNSTRFNNNIQEPLIEQNDNHHSQQTLSFDQQKEREDEDEEEDNRLSIASSISTTSVDSQKMHAKERKPLLFIKQSYNNTCSAGTNTTSVSKEHLASTKKHEATSNKENKHCSSNIKRKHNQYQTSSAPVTIAKKSARLAVKRQRNIFSMNCIFPPLL